MQTLPNSSSLLGIGLVILSASLWATVGVATQLVPEAASLSPEALGLARTVLAGPLILLAVLPRLKASLPAIRALDRGKLLAFALAGVIFQICLFRSFQMLGVTITVFLTVCLPPVIASVAALAQRAAGGPRGLAALVLAVAGLALFSADRLGAGHGLEQAQGLGLAVAASFAFVWMSDAARDLGRSLPPVLVAGLGLTLGGLIFCALGPLLLDAPLQLAGTILRDGRLLALILYLSAVPTALAYICYCSGIARCRSVLVGLTASMVEPAIAAGLAAWLLYERLTPAELAGCALMALAIGVLAQAERQRRVSRES